MPKPISKFNVDGLKRRAKALVKSTGVKHSEALEQLARQAGFANWWALTQAVEVDQPHAARGAHVLFSIEASSLVMDRYRLTVDGKFRLLDDVRGLSELDRKFESVAAARAWIRSQKDPVMLGKKRVPVAQNGVFSLAEAAAEFTVFAHRTVRPELAEHELRQAIATAPRTPCCLLIDLNGHPRVVRFSSSVVNEPDYAVRVESFGDPTSVGPMAAANDDEMSAVLSLVLEGWRLHLQTGEVGVYADYDTMTIEEARAAIREMTRPTGI